MTSSETNPRDLKMFGVPPIAGAVWLTLEEAGDAGATLKVLMAAACGRRAWPLDPRAALLRYVGKLERYAASRGLAVEHDLDARPERWRIVRSGLSVSLAAPAETSPRSGRPPALPVLVDLTPTAAAILALPHASCRWPLSDPGAADFALCGCRAVPGKPYCLDHMRLAFAPSAPRRRVA